MWKVGRRYLVRHPWQSVLMILGIALGVAVVVSIDLANASAGIAFKLSTETLTGKATHQIVGGPQGVDEAVYVALKKSGWKLPAAPVIDVYVSSPELGGRPLQLMGIDPFSDAPFRSFLGPSQAVPYAQLANFFTRPGALLLSSGLAQQYHLGLGDVLQVVAAGKSTPAFVAGLISPQDSLTQRSLEGVLLADISTAQELSGMTGWLSHIDLILPEGQPERFAELENQLPAGYQVSKSSARTGAVEQMTEAFRTNLAALSLLALVVGLFLIYNTMTFSVVQRRRMFGTLRCLGMTRGELFSLVMGEALLVGTVGAVIGIGLGILLGRVTVGMVSQTINDLYFTTTVQAAEISWLSLLKGGGIGLFATLITAAVPAWEAASIPPQAALIRSGLESTTRKRLAWTGTAGVAVIGLALFLFWLPSASLILSFIGTLLAVLGAALITAQLVATLFETLGVVSARLFGLVGRLAPRNLINSLSRTAIAVIALMMAVSVTIGVSIMIDSFRHTVQVWLDQTLQSDIYLSAPIYTATTPSAPMDPNVLVELRKWPGVLRVDSQRTTLVQSRQGQVSLSAIDNPRVGQERMFLALEGSPAEVWNQLQGDTVLLSEPLAIRLGYRGVGQMIELNTLAGWRPFRVIGIYYDYSSSEGTVLMGMPKYQPLWQDTAVTAIGLRIAPGIDPEQLTRELQDGLKNGQALLIRANGTFRANVLMVFDRTFAITVALRMLATLVAFVGVLSALFLLQIEKQHEVGILRALGLTGQELRRMVFVETGLIGLSAGFLALPVGVALSLILIFVINKRSFGWTLQLSIDPLVLLQGVLVALSAALLAGIFPAWRLSRIPAAEAIRYE